MNSTSAERLPVSSFVITKNEEEHIEECLRSLSFCDEIVVVDSYSTDRTADIARSLGARVIQREWPGYRDQKAFALSEMTHEWVVNIDADERVSPELRENILKILINEKNKFEGGQSSESDPVGYYINRVVYFLNRWWRKGGWYPEYRLRFFKCSRVKWGGVEPHERPEPDGPTVRLEGEILHFTYKDLWDQIDRLNRYSSIAASEDFKLGRRFSYSSLFISPFVRAGKFYFAKRGYREGVAGVIVAVLEGFYTFIKYAKLWEQEYNQMNQLSEDKQ